MYYIWTLDSHELFGPFETAFEAIKWGNANKYVYCIEEKRNVESWQWESYREITR